MRRKLFAAFLTLWMSAAVGAGAELPKEIVGMWVSPKSEFDGEKLLGGDIMYLLKDGRVGLVSAPLPVVKCFGNQVCATVIGIDGSASYDAASGKLSLTLRDGATNVAVTADYNARSKTIALHAPDKDLELIRKKKSVPKEVEKVLATRP